MPKLARETAAAVRRVNVNTKVLPEIRSELQDAAEANGRPLAAEIEARLKASVDEPAADLRQIIREEIRAALDIKEARAIGVSVPLGSSPIFHHTV